MSRKKLDKQISLKNLIIYCSITFIITFFIGILVGNTIFADSNNTNQNSDNLNLEVNDLINFNGNKTELKIFCEEFSFNLEETLTNEDSSTLNSKYSLNGVISLCRNSQGRWINDFLECEYIPRDLCAELGGEFNQCTSACRNEPNAWACTRECVPVCDFSNTIFEENNNINNSDNENNLKILDSYQNEVPNNCTNWFDGCNNCLLIEGDLLACTLKYCAKESIQEAYCKQYR